MSVVIVKVGDYVKFQIGWKVTDGLVHTVGDTGKLLVEVASSVFEMVYPDEIVEVFSF